MKTPKISIIIPAYNAEKDIESTLRSLREQTFKDFEIITVNDQSTDTTLKIAKKYTKVITTTKKGLSSARNTGIKNTKANIIAVIDSDCIADNNWAKNIYKEFQKKDIYVIAGDTKVPNSSYLGNCISELGFPGGGNLGFEKMWKVSKENYTNHFTGCNFAIKKDVFKKYGYFNENFTCGNAEDSEFALRLAKHNIKIKFVKNIIVFHKPRKNIKSFIKWHLNRGRGNYHFKREVKDVRDFIKLRIWSTKNIINKNIFNFKIFIIIPLLFLSFICQQIGYMQEKLKNAKQNL